MRATVAMKSRAVCSDHILGTAAFTALYTLTGGMLAALTFLSAKPKSQRSLVQRVGRARGDIGLS